MVEHTWKIVLLVAVFGYFIAQSHCVPTTNGPSQGNSSDKLRPSLLHMDCRGDDGEQLYINDVPHPTDCRLFGKCEFRNGDFLTAIPMNCPESTQFSLKTCKCEYPYSNDTLCYNPAIPEHQAARFSCACSVRLLDGGGYETIGPVDKC